MTKRNLAIMLLAFFRRQGAPALGFFGAGVAAVAVMYNVPWLSFSGSLMAALAVLTISIGQNELTERLLTQAEMIASQAARLEKLVTGGDGIVYLSFIFDGQNRFSLVAMNPGDAPLYGVSADLFDATLAKNTPNPPSNWNWNRRHLEIGDISGHTAKPLGIFIEMPSAATEQSYNIFFNARNGFWTQLQRFYKIGSGWQQAAHIDGVDKGMAPRYEAVSERYPRNSENQVDWD